jgi:hypothetical protein
MDEKISIDVQKLNNGVMTETTEQLSKYEKDVIVPKSIDEEYAESIFEWVKTERLGDISQFKEFKEENGVKYVVFQDNTRINSTLIGDVVLKLKNENERVTMQEALKLESTIPVQQQFISPGISTKSEPTVVNIPNPIHHLLSQSKKKEQTVSLNLEMLLPSDEIYHIVSDNFENGAEEFVQYLLSSLSQTDIENALISALKDKYTTKSK